MALLGLEIPSNITDMLSSINVDGKRDKSDHLTMFYFEDDLSIKQINKICEILSPIIEKTKPFELVINEINSFPAGDDGVPIKGDVQSKELKSLRNKIAKELDNNKIFYSKRYPFNPHVTLSYANEKIKPMKFKNPPKWMNYKLILWGGSAKEGINIEFPFSVKISKSSTLYSLSKVLKSKYGV